MDRAIPYLSLTDAVNEYMLASMNDRRKYFINYLSHAKWIWKKLMWNTLWAMKHKYVEVDTSTTPHSIVIPTDCVRFVNLSEEDDCKSIRSLSFKDNMNVLPKPNKTGCCQVCGEPNPLGECVSNLSVIQKDVVIDNVTYKEKLWKKLCANGDMVEIREFPAKNYNSIDDPEDFTITWQSYEKYICKLDKKPCGCVENTEKNKTLIITHCGCFITSCQKDLCDPMFTKPYARFGVIKIQDGRIYIQGNTNKQFILSYQTNGDCADSELLIPEIAVDALIFGIDYRSKALAPNADRFEKRESERAWNKAKQELEEFLNPIIVTEFMNAQMGFSKWGSSSNFEDHTSSLKFGDIF